MPDKIHLEIEASHAPMLLPIFKQQRIEVQSSVDQLHNELSAAMETVHQLEERVSASSETLNTLDYTINLLSENIPAPEYSENYSQN
jgi:hypothetical protein